MQWQVDINTPYTNGLNKIGNENEIYLLKNSWTLFLLNFLFSIENISYSKWLRVQHTSIL